MNNTIRPQEVWVAPQQTPQPAQLGLNLGELMEPLITFMIVMAMMKMISSMMAPIKPKKEIPFPMPSGYKPVGEWKESKPSMLERVEKAITPQEKKRIREPARHEVVEEDLKAKKASLEAEGKRMARQTGEGIKFVRLDEGWQSEHATVRYWFTDAQDREIVATDVEELKWKLEVTKK